MTDKLDAPEAGPHAVRDHVSFPLRLDASYNDGRERACGEIHFLGYEGNLPIAHIDVHDRLHRATGLMRAVPRKRLRREKSVSEPTTTAVGSAAVREAAAVMDPLAIIVRGTTGHVIPRSAVVVRETTGDVVRPQPTVHAKKQEAIPMSSSTKTTTAQARNMPRGQAAPESGIAIGDHVSWRVNGGVDYIDGGDPMNHRAVQGARACGEVHSLGVDGNTPVAYVDQHDALHHRSGTMPCLAVDQLRHERAVNGTTAFVSGHPAPVREGAGMAPYDNLMGTVREAAGTAPNRPVGTPRAMELLDALLSGR